MPATGKKLLIGALVILVVGGATAFEFFHVSNDATADRLTFSGNIELQQIDVAFKVAGRLVERTVNEGDGVRKGMLLARLDDQQLLSQRQQQEAALRSSEALMREAETSLELQKRTLQADLEVRRAEVRSAEAHLKDLRQGSRPEEIQEASDVVGGAQAEFQRANEDYQRAQRLQKSDDVPLSQLESARTRFESAQAKLRQAQEHLKLLQAGSRPETIEGADAQLARAQGALNEGIANELQIQRGQEEVAVRAAEIDRSKAQMAVIDAQLKDMEVTSPMDGIVLVKSAEIGEILAPGSPVITVGDIEHPWLRAYVSERDLGRIKIGAPVKVTTDSFPGKVYPGHVSFISSEAEFTPKQIQSKEGRVRLVYRIKIAIENSRRELKSNMPADAEIQLSE
jgi:HlyD family secretion protein